MKGYLAVAALLAASTQARADTVKEVVDNWVDGKLPQVMGLCIGAYAEGTGYWRCGGQAGNGSPLTGSTLMAMASVTKTFTATDLATLLVRNQISLDDDVSRLAPASFGVPPGITVEDLADQSSGLPNAWPLPSTSPAQPDDNFTDMAACMENPSCWTGIGPSYSNFGFSILGAIVARALGKPNEWFLATQATVLTPLGINTTGAAPNYPPGYFDAHAAWAFAGSPGNWTATSPDTAANVIPFGGEACGSLWTTANDMHTWLKFNMGAQVGTAPQNGILYEARSWLYQDDFDCFTEGGTYCGSGETGLAWELIATPNGTAIVSKGGNLDVGFHSFIAFTQPVGSTSSKGAWLLVNSDGLERAYVVESIIDQLP